MTLGVLRVNVTKNKNIEENLNIVDTDRKKIDSAYSAFEAILKMKNDEIGLVFLVIFCLTRVNGKNSTRTRKANFTWGELQIILVLFNLAMIML